MKSDTIKNLFLDAGLPNKDLVQVSLNNKMISY